MSQEKGLTNNGENKILHAKEETFSR